MTITRDDYAKWIKAFALVINENKEFLTQLDSAIGDADHGINMDRGFQAVLNKMPSLETQDIGAMSKGIGMVLISTVGGASGPLYGTFFLQIGMTSAGKLELSLTEWITALESAIDGIVKRGKASPGDKTMLDSLMPGLAALKEKAVAGASISEALHASADAAQAGMLATIPWIAKKGRASYLGERSAGTQDPGATSSYLLLKAAADTWNGLS